jgi:signal transduction histidine kinase
MPGRGNEFRVASLFARRLVRRSVQLVVIFCAAALLLTSAMSAADKPKRVIMLYSFGRDFKPWSEHAKAIRDELQVRSPWPLEIIEHSLLTARSSDASLEQAFVDYMRALYAENPPDLIISFGAPAAAFVQRYRSQLFSAAPMLFAAVEQRRVQFSILTASDTVVAVQQNLPALFGNILRVLPDTKTIAIINGDSPGERFWVSEMQRELKPLQQRVDLLWFNTLSFDEILKQSATLPPHSAIFWTQMFVDAAGSVHQGDAAFRALLDVANAPIFTHDDSFFGSRVVGGPMQSVAVDSGRTVDVAIRILSGEPPSKIRLPPSDYARPKYDWREMERWGISEANLPAGREIVFREPSIWEKYRGASLIAISLILLQAALISWLLSEQRQRRRSESTARELSGRLITGQEKERERLARELHDDITQRLAFLAIAASHDDRKVTARDLLWDRERIRDELIRLSEDVHSLSYRLHPTILVHLGLVEALKAESANYSEFAVKLELSEKDVPANLSQDVALCLFRIAQEGLRNIARHAGAHDAAIQLRAESNGLQLTIKDDGAGFNYGQQRPAGLGLESMKQRVLLVHGKFTIRSKPGKGTILLVWVPLIEATA